MKFLPTLAFLFIICGHALVVGRNWHSSPGRTGVTPSLCNGQPCGPYEPADTVEPQPRIPEVPEEPGRVLDPEQPPSELIDGVKMIID